MSVSDRSISKRIISGFIAFLMLAVMLFSAFYITAEAEHDCTGHDCPICVCIQQCENMLQQIGNGAATQFSIVLPILFTILFLTVRTVYVRMETLVSRKIRMNN